MFVGVPLENLMTAIIEMVAGIVLIAVQ